MLLLYYESILSSMKFNYLHFNINDDIIPIIKSINISIDIM